jgi:hypothetical protein
VRTKKQKAIYMLTELAWLAGITVMAIAIAWAISLILAFVFPSDR